MDGRQNSNKEQEKTVEVPVRTRSVVAVIVITCV